jgi:1-deoxy-D-xylulose-5-phosphate reductoisomerase
MVQFRDASVLAQLGTPDMRGPIAYGLSWPDRIENGAAAIDFKNLSAMTFEAIESNDHPARFPGLSLAWEVLRAPAGTTAVLNAANEVAVQAFLDERIRFDQIHAVNQLTLSDVLPTKPMNLEDLLMIDALSRESAWAHVKRLEA